MSVLGRPARQRIAEAGVSVAEYVAAPGWLLPGWHGSRCGCPDDRCLGYHHEADEPCPCLEGVLERLRSE